jgi:hypothetical protein
VRLISIEVPDELPVYEIKRAKLPASWWNDFQFTQWLGSEIIQSEFPLVIKCPSAIVETEFNYLVNPIHETFKKIKYTTDPEFRFDDRLFNLRTTIF